MTELQVSMELMQKFAIFTNLRPYEIFLYKKDFLFINIVQLQRRKSKETARYSFFKQYIGCLRLVRAINDDKVISWSKT